MSSTTQLIEASEDGVVPKVDENITSKLPKGTQILSTSGHGASFWTRTARVETKQPDNTLKSYFLKVANGERGHQMMQGEYESMRALHSIIPSSVPEPYAWGTYKSEANTHFFLCEYREMVEELPDQHKLADKLAKLHLSGGSPEGKFGFGVTTFNGNMPQDNGWADTWEEFFSRSLKHIFRLEAESQGPSKELEKLAGPMFDIVIPRLLRPLETEGRSIQPALVHGDLWYGNMATDADTDEPVIFDACCFWAHNEYELGNWRPVRNRLGPEYVKAYHSHVPIAAPQEDYNDRNALYAMYKAPRVAWRFNAHASTLFPADPQYRISIIDEMRRLVDKYA